MNLCNYNYNIMSLNLFGISTNTFIYEDYPRSGMEVIIISVLKYYSPPYLTFYKRYSENALKNQWNLAKIAYHLLALEKTMKIKFSG